MKNALKKMRSWGAVFICILLLLMTGCVKKPADLILTPEVQTPTGSKMDQKIIQLVTENYIPYQFKENGLDMGIAVDVVNEIFKRLGYTVELTQMPWTRALQTIQDNEADGIFCAYLSTERTAFMDYMNEPIAYDAQFVYTLVGSDVVFDGTLKSLEPYRIGVLQDWFYGEDFATRIVEGTLMVEAVTDLPININKLLDGKIDVLINPQINTEYYLKQLSLQDKIIQQPAPFREPAGLYLAFTKSRNIDLALRKKVDEELFKMKADGSYQEIVDRYTK